MTNSDRKATIILTDSHCYFNNFLSFKPRLIFKFSGFLTTVQEMNNITRAKQISTLKTLLNYARTEYKIEVNPDYKDFKNPRKDASHEVIALTQEEFEAIQRLESEGYKPRGKTRSGCKYSLAWQHWLNLQRWS